MPWAIFLPNDNKQYKTYRVLCRLPLPQCTREPSAASGFQTSWPERYKEQAFLGRARVSGSDTEGYDRKSYKPALPASSTRSPGCLKRQLVPESAKCIQMLHGVREGHRKNPQVGQLAGAICTLVALLQLELRSDTPEMNKPSISAFSTYDTPKGMFRSQKLTVLGIKHSYRGSTRSVQNTLNCRFYVCSQGPDAAEYNI